MFFQRLIKKQEVQEQLIVTLQLVLLLLIIVVSQLCIITEGGNMSSPTGIPHAHLPLYTQSFSH